MLKKPINVLIISQQAFLRHGLEIALSPVEDINIIVSIDFGNGTEFSLEKHNPDVVILDIDGQGEAGLKMSMRIKHYSPNIGVIVLTSTPDDEQIFQALKNQASAFLSKDVTNDQIIDMIRRVVSADYPINESLVKKPKVAVRVLEQFQKLCMQDDYEPFMSPITTRETEVLQLLSRGYGNKQMAPELGISKQTVKNHITSILRKLNANARTEAVVTAIKQGIISLD